MTAATIHSRAIPIELIDEPSLAMREEFDEIELDELSTSIRTNGLIEPIIVRPRGARFEVVAGHRRLLACRRAGLGDVPAIVRDVDDAAAEAIKVAENVDRAAVNPVEEATYFAELLDRHCGDDVDRLCEFVKRRRPYVEERLLLLRGAPEVLDALRAKKIPMAVAQELNKFSDRAGTLMYLDYALNGATAKQVRDWRRQYADFAARNPGAPIDGAAATTDIAAAPAMSSHACPCCGENANMNRLIAIYVHDYCYEAQLKRLLKTLRGEA